MMDSLWLRVITIQDFLVFMTNPIRVRSVEIYKKGDKPLTKLRKDKGDDEIFVDLMRKASATPSKIK